MGKGKKKVDLSVKVDGNAVRRLLIPQTPDPDDPGTWRGADIRVRGEGDELFEVIATHETRPGWWVWAIGDDDCTFEAPANMCSLYVDDDVESLRPEEQIIEMQETISKLSGDVVYLSAALDRERRLSKDGARLVSRLIDRLPEFVRRGDTRIDGALLLSDRGRVLTDAMTWAHMASHGSVDDRESSATAEAPVITQGITYGDRGGGTRWEVSDEHGPIVQIDIDHSGAVSLVYDLDRPEGAPQWTSVLVRKERS